VHKRTPCANLNLRCRLRQEEFLQYFLHKFHSLIICVSVGDECQPLQAPYCTRSRFKWFGDLREDSEQLHEDTSDDDDGEEYYCKSLALSWTEKLVSQTTYRTIPWKLDSSPIHASSVQQACHASLPLLLRTWRLRVSAAVFEPVYMSAIPKPVKHCESCRTILNVLLG
jgi:hypothetical protein